MKTFFSLALLFCLSFSLGCSSESETTNLSKKEREAASTKPVATSTAIKFTDQIVGASCGQCQLGMDGNGCDLAVRIDGKTYFVDGSSIDDHGDAHGDDGLCNCIRQAKITGEIKGGRLVATTIQILPQEK
ncbi:MAG: hypothetical protein ACI87E_000019 [Mariniblastus sp.]|jgi:hypothetical protein